MTRKQAVQAVLFLGIFLIILSSLTYVIRTNGDIKDIFTGFYAEDRNSVDVIMIGSSPVYPFYASPKIWGETGITCYPLSSNVQRPGAAIPLIKEAYKTQQPEVFVFEMRMYTMEDGDMAENMAYARGVTDNLKYSLNRIEAINRLVTTKEERYTYYFDIFKYHSNWKTMVLPEQIKCITYEKKNPLKGFVIRDEVFPIAKEDVRDYTDITEQLAIPEEQELRLRELLDYLNEKEQRALFIVSPYPLEENEMKMFNYMQAIVEQAGYTFVNMNQHYEEMGLNFATDYYDDGHVNTAGAVKCTEYLEKLLQEFSIEDKRNLPGYESYEEAYQYYLEREQEALCIIRKNVKEGG